MKKYAVLGSAAIMIVFWPIESNSKEIGDFVCSIQKEENKKAKGCSYNIFYSDDKAKEYDYKIVSLNYFGEEVIVPDNGAVFDLEWGDFIIRSDGSFSYRLNDLVAPANSQRFELTVVDNAGRKFLRGIQLNMLGINGEGSIGKDVFTVDDTSAATLYGQSGDDFFIINGGNSAIFGGEGSDTFRVMDYTIDVIEDFSIGDLDKIDLTRLFQTNGRMYGSNNGFVESRVIGKDTIISVFPRDSSNNIVKRDVVILRNLITSVSELEGAGLMVYENPPVK